MLKHMFTIWFLTCIVVLPARAEYGSSRFYNVLNDRQQFYSQPDLEEAIEAKENVLNLMRRNIDPDDYWSGRWFPERVMESNEYSDVSSRVVTPITHDPDESWPSRWFPDKIYEPLQNNSLSSRVENPVEHDPEESWPGRWFPDRVTESPENTNSLETSPAVNSIKHDPPESWTGKWLPERVTEAAVPIHHESSNNHDMQRMLSDVTNTCDDGKTNLTVDWDESPINYTCFNQGGIFMPDMSVSTIIRQQLIPPKYHARHVCMDSEIHYASLPPTFGPHRPAWAKYGEYKFLPMQRWIHNLEHGAVVMLYHPCAHPILIQELRSIVKNCLYRHIITPYTHLSPQRPLALVTWGWMMLMPDVNPNRVIEFIETKALNGPEHLSEDGQYDHLLLEHAEVISTEDDEIICPRESF